MSKRQLSKQSATELKETNLQKDNISSYQKFKVIPVNRCDIKNAPYNPRIIDAHSKEKLKAKIKKIGLLEPLVLNKRTGNLVSGHQRLSILDDLEQTSDYTLLMSVVNLTPSEEKEMVVFFNNPSSQGMWDLDLLKEIVIDPIIDIKELGFDNVDIQMLFDGDTELSTLFKESETATKDMRDFKQLTDKVNKDSERRAVESDPDHYVVITFPSRFTCEQFLTELNLDKREKYIDGAKMAKLLNIKLVY